MAHKFPIMRFHAGWPMDASEVDDLLQAVAEEIEGRLNEHNFKANTFNVRTDCAAGAVLDVNNTFTVVNPSLDMTDGSALVTYPTRSFPPTDQQIVSHNSEWQVVTTVPKFTANSLLWALGSLQVQLTDGGPTSPVDTEGVQVALRLDGTVIEETLVGGLDRPNDPEGEAVKMQAGGLATDFLVPVAPGQHKIELVARLVKDAAMAQPSSSEVAAIGTRELILLTLDPHQSVVSGAGASWTPILEGDVVGTAVDTPAQALRAEFNSLDFPAVQPESLTHAHLTGCVVSSSYSAMVAGVTVTSVYPGWDNNTTGVSPGWTVIDSSTFTAVDFTDTTIAGALVIANVEVQNISVAGYASELLYAVFALQVRSGGTWRTVAKTERYTNGEIVVAIPDQQLSVWKNMPIRTFIRSTDLDGGTDLDGVRIVGSCANRQSAIGVLTVLARKSDLSVAILQAGS